MLALALFLAASSMNASADARDVGMRFPSSGAAPSLTIDAMPYTRTVTCGSYTLTGSASGGGAVSWSASPSGESGSCTGTTSWSCVVAIAPDASGEGVETITVSQAGGASDTETIGFYVSGAHTCLLAQNVDGTFNSTLADMDAVTTWQNIGSSALDATQAGAASLKPTFRTGIVTGQPIVRFDGGDYLIAGAASDWAFTNNGTAFTIDIAQNNTSGTGTRAWSSTSSGLATSTTLVRMMVGRGDTNRAFASMANGAAQIFQNLPTSNTLTQGQWNLIQWSVLDDGGAGNDSFLYTNNGTAVAAAASGSFSASNPSAALGVGGSAGGFSLMIGDLFRFAIYQSVLTSTQRGINKAVDEWAIGGTFPYTAVYTPLPPDPDRWLVVGDSLSADSATDWPDQLEASTGKTVVNKAASGASSAVILSQWTTHKDPTPGKVFVLGGINDIRTGVSAATAYASLSTIYSEAQALGTEVVCIPTLPFGNNVNWTAGRQTELESLSASITADVNCDVVVDIYGPMGEPGSPEDLAAIYDSGDGLHPSATGQSEMKALIAAALGV